MLKNLEKAESGNIGNMLGCGKGRCADSALRFVDDPFKTKVVRRIGNHGHIRKHIFNFLAFIELKAADDFIGHTRSHESSLKACGLGMHSVKNGKIAVICAF